jgi:hypothetical protein
MMARMQQGRGGAGGAPAGYPGAPGAAGQGGAAGGSGNQQAEMMARMQQGRGGAGMAGPGGIGNQADNGPADTHSPDGAVRAFLNALRAKDRDKLAEATALRAQREAATSKNQDLFGRIIDMSISDAELDDLSKKFEGFRVAGENAAKTTATLGVYVDRQTEHGDLQRITLTVRKEKKGWGVMDFGSPTLFKAMSGNQRRPTGRR